MSPGAPTPGVLGEWLVAAWTTSVTAVVVGTIAMSVGLALGAAAAFGPRVVDSLLSRAIEVAAGIPSVIVALVVARTGEAPSFVAVSVTLALLRGLETAKIVRRELITLGAAEFAIAAMALGSSRTRLFRKHLLPHVMGAAIASASLTTAAVVSLEASLSFLGLQSLGPTFGAAIAEGALARPPALAVAPVLGVAITLAALHVAGTRLAARFSTGRSYL